jgi:hypothetical protein
MSDSEEELIVLAVAVSKIINSATNIIRKRPRFRVNPYLKLRKIKGRFHRDVSS